jgi:hypothetical protein
MSHDPEPPGCFLLKPSEPTEGRSSALVAELHVTIGLLRRRLDQPAASPEVGDHLREAIKMIELSIALLQSHDIDK